MTRTDISSKKIKRWQISTRKMLKILAICEMQIKNKDTTTHLLQ